MWTPAPPPTTWTKTPAGDASTSFHISLTLVLISAKSAGMLLHGHFDARMILRQVRFDCTSHVRKGRSCRPAASPPHYAVSSAWIVAPPIRTSERIYHPNRFRPMLEACEDRTTPTPTVTIAALNNGTEGGS